MLRQILSQTANQTYIIQDISSRGRDVNKQTDGRTDGRTDGLATGKHRRRRTFKIDYMNDESVLLHTNYDDDTNRHSLFFFKSYE